MSSTLTTVSRVPPESIRKYVEEYKVLTREERIAEANKLTTITLDICQRWSALVFLHEQAGGDPSDFQTTMVYYFRRVAEHRLDPRWLPRGAGYPAIMDKIMDLPLSVQEKLLENPTIKVADVKPSGEIYEMPYDVLHLSPKHARQVFTKDGLRSFEEQVKILRAEANPIPKPVSTPLPSAVKVEKSGINITGPCFLSKKQLLAILGQYTK